MRRLRDIAELAAAFVPSRERQLETSAQGRAFIEIARAAWNCDGLDRMIAACDGAIVYPVAVGLVSAAHAIPLAPTLHAFLHALVSNWISAGARLVPLGQTDSQRVLALLEPVVAATGSARAGGLARRSRQRHLSRRSRQHAARDAVYEAVQVMMDATHFNIVVPANAGTHNARAHRVSARWAETFCHYERPVVMGPGVRRDDDRSERTPDMPKSHGPLRIGIGGPVGSGKTALMDLLCKSMRERYDIAAITNDIYTKWDAEFLVRSGSLTPDRIAGVETGGCPHTAIREDASMNLAAVADMRAKFPDLDLVLIESGGDNLAATFSPELADLTIYVIDVAAGDKIPSKGGPGITRSDLLVINKIDLAPHVGASLEKMDTDARRMRGERPFVMTNLKKSEGLDRIIGFIEAKGGLSRAGAGQGELKPDCVNICGPLQALAPARASENFRPRPEQNRSARD